MCEGCRFKGEKTWKAASIHTEDSPGSIPALEEDGPQNEELRPSGAGGGSLSS